MSTIVDHSFRHKFTLRSDSPASRRLNHLTFAVKENMSVAGYPVSMGGARPILTRAAETAPIVQHFLAQGASCCGIVCADEDCLGSLGILWDGSRVENPNYPPLLCGGSSCGSAAAVARSSTSFALGSDYGGSVRIPAAACGIVGYKPSPNVFSSEGVLSYHAKKDTPGILTRSVRELLEVLNHNEPLASFSLKRLSDFEHACDITTSERYIGMCGRITPYLNGAISWKPFEEIT